MQHTTGVEDGNTVLRAHTERPNSTAYPWPTARKTHILQISADAASVTRRQNVKADITMKIPLAILALLSVAAGFIETPRGLGNVTLFSDFMESVMPALPAVQAGPPGMITKISLPLVSVIGLYLAYLLFLRWPDWMRRVTETAVGSLLHAYWFSGWGFDWLYGRLIVKPFMQAADWNKEDVIDLGYAAIAWVSTVSSIALTLTQTGKIRWYAAAIALGALIFIGIAVIG